jgi:hypothetical protein
MELQHCVAPIREARLSSQLQQLALQRRFLLLLLLLLVLLSAPRLL